MATIPANTSWTLDPSMLFENGQTAFQVSPGGGPSYWNVGNLSRWKYTTDARKIRITGYATAGGLQAFESSIVVIVNDRAYFFPPPATVNAYFDTGWLFLPVGAAKVVEVVVPGAGATSAGGAPKGVYPIAVTFDAPATEIAPSLQAQHLVIYGDSITTGTGAVAAAFGWAPLMQQPVANGGWNGSVTLVSYGYRCLYDDCNTGPKQTAFAAKIAALNPTKLLMAIGSNDWAVITVSPSTTFRAYYDGTLDALHAAMPTLPIVCMSPIRRGTELPSTPVDVNFGGNTLQEFRDQISASVAARAGWSVPPVYIDGLPIFADLSHLTSGKTHPTTIGHKIMHDYIFPLI